MVQDGSRGHTARLARTAAGTPQVLHRACDRDGQIRVDDGRRWRRAHEDGHGEPRCRRRHGYADLARRNRRDRRRLAAAHNSRDAVCRRGAVAQKRHTRHPLDGRRHLRRGGNHRGAEGALPRLGRDEAPDPLCRRSRRRGAGGLPLLSRQGDGGGHHGERNRARNGIRLRREAPQGNRGSRQRDMPVRVGREGDPPALHAGHLPCREDRDVHEPDAGEDDIFAAAALRCPSRQARARRRIQPNVHTRRRRNSDLHRGRRARACPRVPPRRRGTDSRVHRRDGGEARSAPHDVEGRRGDRDGRREVDARRRRDGAVWLPFRAARRSGGDTHHGRRGRDKSANRSAELRA